MSDLMTRSVIMMPLDLAMSSELSRLQFHSRAQDVLRERDTYRELCGEMLKQLKRAYHEQNCARDYLLESVIEKSEQLLGEKNGTSN